MKNTENFEENEVKFDMDAVNKSFTNYNSNKIFDGIVVSKREDGVVFNIGGKSDSFIPKEDFSEFENVKIGDSFKVMIIGKTPDGMILTSKSKADDVIIGTQTAQNIKLGSKFSFVVMEANNEGLSSKLGEYGIFIPFSEIDSKPISFVGKYKNKHMEAVAVEIIKNSKKIIASVKKLMDKQEEIIQNAFWTSIFINKVVEGKVVKIMPYGAFVKVNGVDCFIHISDLSWERIENPNQVIQEGETKQFKVIKIDKENKKVSLGLKQLEESPRDKMFKEIKVGQEFDGVVEKFLPMGAIISLENGLHGLLHVNNATTFHDKTIYEILRLGQKVKVEIIYIDKQNKKISFKKV